MSEQEEFDGRVGCLFVLLSSLITFGVLVLVALWLF
jgi:hypothetical protein